MSLLVVDPEWSFGRRIGGLQAWLDGRPREEIGGWQVRAIAGLLVWALLHTAVQTKAVYESTGINPIKPRFDRMRADFPAPWRWLYYPSFYHACHADWFISASLYFAGVAGGVLVFTGLWSRMGLFLMWATWLSLATVSNDMYPWSCFMLEQGFLSLFLPNLELGVTGGLVCEARPLVLFSLRYLLWRLMFGFGKMKFSEMRLNDLSYLKGFLISQPFPTVIGWLLAQAPVFPIHVVSYFFLFLAEIPGPFAIFFCGWPRLLAFCLVAGLQFGIQFTGTFGFFNVATLALSTCLLDLQSSLTGDFSLERDLLAGGGTEGAITLLLSFVLLLHCVYLPFNTWCSSAFLYWPALNYPPAALGNLLRLLQPFHLSHAFGVFFPHSSPHLKWIPQIEGTDQEVIDPNETPEEQAAARRNGAVDEQDATWRFYTYRFMVSDPYLTPRFIAPYHPRIEHAILYESMGLGTATFMANVTSGDPYEHQPVHMLEGMCNGLMRENPDVEDLFRSVPFGRRSESGKRVRTLRVGMYVFIPTSISELVRTGRWYNRFFSHIHIPLVTLRSFLAPTKLAGKLRVKEPETWHPEAVIWQARTPIVRRLWQGVDRAVMEKRPLTSALAAHTPSELADIVAAPRPADTDVYEFQSFAVAPAAVAAFWRDIVGPIQLALDMVREPVDLPLHPLRNGSRNVGLKDAVLMEARNRPFRVDRPWNAEEPGHWSRVLREEVLVPIVSKWTRAEKSVYEKTLARLTLVMVRRLTPFFRGPDAKEPMRTVETDADGVTPISPRLSCPDGRLLCLPSFFHFYLFCHHLIGLGESTYDSVLADPAIASRHLSTYCLESSLFLLGVFHAPLLAFGARKRRLAEGAGHASLMGSGGITPGFLAIGFNFLRDQFSGPAHAMMPEFHPTIRQPQSAFDTWFVSPEGMPLHAPGRQPTEGDEQAKKVD